MSDPSLKRSDVELELDDAECRRIVSDVLHNLSDLSDPSPKRVDEKLVLVDDECAVASDHALVLSDSSEPSIQPLDDEEAKIIKGRDFHPLVEEEGSQVKKLQGFLDAPSTHPDEKLMVLDNKRQIFSEQLQGFSDPSSMNLDEEQPLDSDQLHRFSYPLEHPSKPLEEEPVIVDPVVEERSQAEKLQGFSDPPSMNLDEELTLNPDQLHGFLYPLEPPSKPLEEELIIVDPVVEERSQSEKEEGKQNITSDSSGQVVLQDIEHEDIKENMDLDESKMVSDLDQLHVLSDPSESSLQSVEELVCIDGAVNEGLNVEKHALKSVDEAAEADNLEYYTFSLTKHRFNMILTNSQVSRKYCMFLPKIMVEVLPQEKVPVVLNSYGKIWNTFYNGHLRAKVFEYSGWKKFVLDNKLKMGDGCFFEVLENSRKKVVFKVVILRNDSSPSCVGASPEKPIFID